MPSNKVQMKNDNNNYDDDDDDDADIEPDQNKNEKSLTIFNFFSLAARSFVPLVLLSPSLFLIPIPIRILRFSLDSSIAQSQLGRNSSAQFSSRPAATFTAVLLLPENLHRCESAGGSSVCARRGFVATAN